PFPLGRGEIHNWDATWREYPGGKRIGARTRVGPGWACGDLILATRPRGALTGTVQAARCEMKAAQANASRAFRCPNSPRAAHRHGRMIASHIVCPCSCPIGTAEADRGRRDRRFRKVHAN